jgi:signal transduction histidine kinase
VTTTVDGDRRPVSPGVDRGAYRILQEALTNVARHGDGGARVHVTFGRGALEFSVANPVGPDRGAHNGGGGHGLVRMRERAALLGGSLEAGSDCQQFRIRARLPLVDDGG